MKKCLYCSEEIHDNDDYEKIGKKYICVFCYEEEYLADSYDKSDYYIEEDDSECNIY